MVGHLVLVAKIRTGWINQRNMVKGNVIHLMLGVKIGTTGWEMNQIRQ